VQRRLRDVVRREFRRAFHAPFIEPGAVVVNGLQYLADPARG
jgi:hypothetical protein